MRKRAGVVVTAMLAGLAGGVVLAPAASAGTPTQIFAEQFTGATITSNLVKPPGGTSTNSSGQSVTVPNRACLTSAAASPTQTPIPQCTTVPGDVTTTNHPVTFTPDADGSGLLRLTNEATSEKGSVFSGLSIPTRYGLDVTFDSYQWSANPPTWNGSASTKPYTGDGISFSLAATDPAAPATPTSIGGSGGALGYVYADTNGGVGGLPNGYLGIGLDEFGTFSAPGYFNNWATTGGACPASYTFSGDQSALTVRGPGNGHAGYCVDKTTYASGPSSTDVSQSIPFHAASRAAAKVPVEVAINPTGAAATTAGGLTVPANSYLVSVQALAANASGALGGTHTLVGDLPKATGSAPSGWLDGNGVPKQLTFGWTSSTGAATDNHEIGNVVARTLTDSPPRYALTSSGTAFQGSNASVVFSPSLGTGGSEPSDTPATFSATLPAGYTATSATGTGWTCTSGSTVQCTYTHSDPLDPNSALPPITLTVPIASTATGSLSVPATLSSGDGLPATTTASIPIQNHASPSSALSLSDGGSPAPALSSPVGHAVTAQLALTGATSDAGGSVTYDVATDPACQNLVQGASSTVAVTNGAVPASAAQTLPAGSYYWRGTYSGDPHNDPTATTCSATTLTVTKLDQHLTFTQPPTGPVYGGSFQPSATSDGGGSVPITYAAGSSSPGCSTTDGTTFSFTGVGDCTVVASRTGDDTYDPATATETFTVLPAAQDVSFTSPLPTNPAVGGTYQPVATGPADGNPVTISLDSTSSGCSLTNGQVTFTHASACVLRADQPADAFHTAGVALQTINVGKGSQTLAFSSHPDTPTAGGQYTAVAAGGPTTGTVTYQAGDGSTGCTVTPDGQVSFTDVGTCVIVATLAGNDDYDPASTTQTFAVTPSAQAITFTSEPVNATYGGTYQVRASGGASGNPVTFTSGTPLVCVVDPSGAASPALVRFVGNGPCTINADQLGTAHYQPAPTTPQTFTVGKAALTVLVDDATRRYSEGNPSFTGRLVGVVPGDVLSPSYTTNVPSTADAKVYGGAITATVAGASAANYAVSVTPGTLTVTPMPTRLAITSPPTAPSGGSTVTAALTDDLGRAVSGKPVVFSAGSGATTISGVGTSNPATAKLSLPVGSYSLVASFAGDGNYTKSASPAQALTVYQPTSFVIWGGNPGGLDPNAQYTFWGAQWAKQVTGGTYQAGNGFKGWASSVSSDGKSFTAASGNSVAPPASVGQYVNVLVASSIRTSGSGYTGTVLRTAVLKVVNPASYGPDPGKPGYGVLVPGS